MVTFIGNQTRRTVTQPKARGPRLTWKDKAIAATNGSQFGAILRCASERNTDQCPRFEGKAYITSDGFVMCSFVTRDGEYKSGAFVGSAKDLYRNVDGLSAHLRLSVDDQAALKALVDGWVASDYRSQRVR